MKTLFINFIRAFLVMLVHTTPSEVGMVMTKLCNRLPAHPDEEGSFRTDIAFCALGLLRNGDIKGFEYWIAKYPFQERWQGFFHPHFFRIAFSPERGWHIENITHCPRQYGESLIQPEK